MPVLEGEQGTGKSTALRYLFGDRFFIDHLPDFHSKDSFQQLQGAWCVEVAELSALTKADVKDVKQFLSRLVDKFRPPFGRLPIQVPRRSVFWGTVNPEEGGYLRDPTGARRFWPIETTVIDTDAILRDRDQLWAEAVAAFIAGEKWHLDDDDDIADAKAEQAKRREVHPWEPVLEAWLRAENLLKVTMPRRSRMA
jgi:putative DNA primase/helicase